MFSAISVHADEGDWTFGLTVGAYQPSLRTLNRIIQDPNQALIQDPNFQLTPNQTFPVEVRNIVVPQFNFDNSFGFSLNRNLSEKHGLVITLNVWSSTQEAQDIVPQITGVNLVGDPQLVPRLTRYDLSITQLWLGWRYSLYNFSPRNRIFLDIGLIGLSFAQLTIDTLLKVAEPVGAGFPIVSSLEADGWGMTSRWGLGASYAINKWVGISIRAAYVFGRVSRMRVNRFFPSGFSGPPPPDDPTLLPDQQPPPGIEPLPEQGDRIESADVNTESPRLETRVNRQPLVLELDGFEGMIALEFYF